MAVKPKPSRFDRWLDEQLRGMFGAVAEEPIPPTLLRVLEDAERGRDVLPRTDELLARGHVLVRRQQRLVDRLMADGHETALADAVLATMTESLGAMSVHRDTIRSVHLDRMARGLNPSRLSALPG